MKGKEEFLGKREAMSTAGERSNRTTTCMYSFDEYLLNTFSLTSRSCMKLLLLDKHTPKRYCLKKEICDQRGLSMLHTAALFGDLRMRVSTLQALRAPAVRKPFQCCLTENFPTTWPQNPSFILDTYSHPEKLLLKRTHKKHCLTPGEEGNVRLATDPPGT